ncbi:MAG: response regulator, partial [Rubripirellula sp.]
MLVLSRRADDSIVFPGLGITIHILRLNRQVARVGIEAPPEIRVLRRELADGSTEETFDVNEFKLASVNTREQLHTLRNQLNVINLGLQYYRHQMDAGLIDEANKTFLRVVERLNQMEREIGEQVDAMDEQNTIDQGSQESADQTPIQVLLVEDDEQQRELLAGILMMRGFDVATASSGNEALQYLNENDTPDFVLMDMRMPEGDGASTIRNLRANCNKPQLRILATSGSE